MKFKNFVQAQTLSLANLLCVSNPNLAKELKKCEFRYISCFEDSILGSENLIRCEIGSISYVLALLCKNYGIDGEYFDELDDGFISGECNVGEEEFQELSEWLKQAKQIIIDDTFFSHPDAKMLFNFLALLDKDIILANGDKSEFDTDLNLIELSELKNYDGSVVYKIKSDEVKLIGGVNFALVSKIKDGNEVMINGENLQIKVKFEQDNSLKGTVALLYMPKPRGYAFELVRVCNAN
ncbi:MAG: hypothetical protein K5978_05575 [Campylobacter sp.]|nr:hypothetical protein [Campylobacter sp.]